MFPDFFCHNIESVSFAPSLSEYKTEYNASEWVSEWTRDQKGEYNNQHYQHCYVLVAAFIHTNKNFRQLRCFFSSEISSAVKKHYKISNIYTSIQSIHNKKNE